MWPSDPPPFVSSAVERRASACSEPPLLDFARSKRVWVSLLLISLAACDASVSNRTERSGEVKVSGVEEIGNDSSVAPEGVGAPAAWRVRDGAAFYGSADQPPQFALRCDRNAQQIIIERAGSGPAITVMAGSAGGSYTARAVNGRLQARVALGDPLLEAMSRSQSQIDIGGLSVPGGVAIRRVVEWCRTPPEPTPEPGNAVTPALGPANVIAPMPVASPTP